jgi:hypothetical protein
MNARVADGNDPVTGHIISTTSGGKNGEPKQVIILGDTFLFTFLFFMVVLSYTVFMIWLFSQHMMNVFVCADHQLHGGAGCGNRVVWYSLPGIQMCLSVGGIGDYVRFHKLIYLLL